MFRRLYRLNFVMLLLQMISWSKVSIKHYIHNFEKSKLLN
jgi:hypothetical protein